MSSNRRGYSISKGLVKLTRFKSFPLQLPGHQDIPLLSFVRVASSTLIRCGWVFISARSVENCISVERLNTLNTDLQSLLKKHQIICSRLNTVKFVKKTLQHRCFEKFLRTPFYRTILDDCLSNTVQMSLH